MNRQENDENTETKYCFYTQLVVLLLSCSLGYYFLIRIPHGRKQIRHTAENKFHTADTYKFHTAENKLNIAILHKLQLVEENKFSSIICLIHFCWNLTSIWMVAPILYVY